MCNGLQMGATRASDAGEADYMREAIGIDLYNQCVTGGVAKTLNAIKSDSDHVPCVLMMNWDGSQTAPTLTSRNAGGGQRMPDKENFNCVIVKRIENGVEHRERTST